ncbi:nuclear transport factor 2 family protein [Streptomyces sp. NPDC015220]|uniref:nuclear transport factor 2 family protein n=1 Tax=Streptomyces sp. NPDC015220 TaxID=3364947 RepID=UPI0036F8C55D
MPHRPSTPVLALAGALLLAGCSEGLEQAGSPPRGSRQAAPGPVRETAGQPPAVSPGAGRTDPAVDPAAQAYVDAVAAEDLDALVAAFRPDARLVDVEREFTGHDEIRDWARNEVIGGRLTVLKSTPKSNGTTLLVHFAPGGSGGFEATYDFDVRDGRIAALDLQYA